MTSKHTPGPWEIAKDTNEKGDLYIWKVGNHFGDHAIATVHGEIQESAKANAHLIATAPELLEACKDFVFLEKTNMSKKQVKLRIEIAKQAITKATKEVER